MVFNGKEFAEKIEEGLRGSTGKLVIMVTDGNESGRVYGKMKKELGERIGVEVQIVQIANDKLQINLKSQIEKLANDPEVKGIMVQLPIVGLGKEETQKVLDLIPVEKDVDGLTSENLNHIKTGEQLYLPATVKAVGKVMDEAIRVVSLDIDKMRVAVVGSAGMVGKPLVDQLKRFGFEVGEFDESILKQVQDDTNLKEYDVVISAVGKEGLIKPEMLKDGVVAIDVGFPKGDFSPEVEKKAAFFTPVPGGVGPVTVVSLFENLVNRI